MESPYRLNSTNQTLVKHNIIPSVRKIQKMPLIPLRENLTCSSICKGKS